MDAKNLQPFIDEDLRHGSKKWNTETNVDLCELIQFQTAKRKPLALLFRPIRPAKLGELLCNLTSTWSLYLNNWISEVRKSHFVNQLQTAKEKPARGGLNKDKICEEMCIIPE